MSRSSRVGWRGQKQDSGQNVAPTQQIFDLTDAFVFSGGMPDTIRGPKMPESAESGPIYPELFLCWGVFTLYYTTWFGNVFYG